ncbi:MAG: hypothetical protein D6705_04980 [Deltaproteobacteria bacterium]|nr:MAG: hypothetical protein D6705_04980 [Deltaproteobacteria bacterium]
MVGPGFERLLQPDAASPRRRRSATAGSFGRLADGGAAGLSGHGRPPVESSATDPQRSGAIVGPNGTSGGAVT